MATIWFLIAIIMGCLYWYLEFVVWQAHWRRLTPKSGILKGKKAHYTVGVTIITFVGLTCFYLSMIHITQSPFQFSCWFTPVSLIALVAGVSMNWQLRYLTFAQDKAEPK